MLAGVFMALCFIVVFLMLFLPAWIAFDELLLEPMCYLFSLICEYKEESHNRAKTLYLPYISWSDTVAHPPTQNLLP